MKELIIGDIGSTTGSWCVVNASGSRYFKTSGYNPFNHDVHVLERALSIVGEVVAPGASLVYYGTGVSSEAIAQSIAAKVSIELKTSSTEVHSDLLGAARAVCGDTEGIIAILGTGSNCAWYDGESLAHRTPSLGYPLGDEGGGWRIGTAMLQGYYYGFMPEQLQSQFKTIVPDERVELLEYLRQSATPNRYLASFATFAAQNISDDWVRDTVKTCLNEFVVKHVVPHFSDGCIHGVGGIANTFQEILKDVLQHYSLQVGRIVGDPLPDLVNYHMIHE